MANLTDGQYAAVGAGVSGGAGLFGTAINAISQAVNNRRNREYALQDYFMQLQIENAQNEMERIYNLPENQVQRFVDAGLNPNLLTGHSSTQNYAQRNFREFPQASPVQFGNMSTIVGQAISNYLAVQQAQKNKELMDAQIDELKSRSERNRNTAFLDLWRGWNQHFDYQGKSSINYWNLKGQEMNNNINRLYQDAFHKYLQNQFDMYTWNSRAKVFEFKWKLERQMEDYYKRLGLKVDSDKEYIDAKAQSEGVRKELMEQQKQWNEMTRVQKLSLLNSAMTIAASDARYRDTFNKLQKAGMIEKLALAPFEVISKYIPSNILQTLFNLGGDMPNSSFSWDY